MRTLIQAFRTKELRNKILFVLGMIIIYRIGSYIPAPGVDETVVNNCVTQMSGNSENFIGLVNLFSGGAMLQLSIFALGVMPYITASIVIQLLRVVIPRFEALHKEGQSGEAKLTQYTRYLTIGLALLQSSTIVVTAKSGALFNYQCSGIIPNDDVWTLIVMVLVMTGGTGLIMWMAELITEKGIGQGMSILIFLSICIQIKSKSLIPDIRRISTDINHKRIKQCICHGRNLYIHIFHIASTHKNIHIEVYDPTVLCPRLPQSCKCCLLGFRISNHPTGKSSRHSIGCKPSKQCRKRAVLKKSRTCLRSEPFSRNNLLSPHEISDIVCILKTHSRFFGSRLIGIPISGTFLSGIKKIRHTCKISVIRISAGSDPGLHIIPASQHIHRTVCNSHTCFPPCLKRHDSFWIMLCKSHALLLYFFHRKQILPCKPLKRKPSPKWNEPLPLHQPQSA